MSPDLYSQANSLLNAGQPAKAIPLYLKAVKDNPNLAEAYHNLAIAYEQTGQLQHAFMHFQTALRLDTHNSLFHFNFGNFFMNQGQYVPAIQEYSIAIRNNPQLAVAHLNMGVSYYRLGELVGAEKSLRQAIALQPSADTHSNLGNLYLTSNRLELALEQFRAAHQYNPDHIPSLSSLIHTAQTTLDWPTVTKLTPHLNKLVVEEINSTGISHDSAFHCLLRSPDPQLNRRVATALSQKVQNSVHIDPPPFTHQPHRKKKLRLGYLSYDFRDHVIAYHIMSVFRHHDRKKFHATAYSYSNPKDNKYSKYIQSHADSFVDINKKNHLVAAKQINDDAIDILIDLAGHTQNNRLAICALQPAPLIINYLGYPGTTGAKFIDYIIADQHLIPSKDRQHYSESVVYLPHGYQISSYDQLSIPQTPSRKSQQLPKDAVVFAAFNGTYKLDLPTATAWLKLLKDVPNSILWIKEMPNITRNHFTALAKKHKIRLHRIIYALKVPFEDHLARLPLADIALDTPSYNGGSTTSNLLYMGVPVITIAGTHYPSRMSTALLHAVRLPELITANLDDYFTLARSLATDKAALEKFRKSLIVYHKSTKLFDSKTITRDLESAYLAMWDRYRSGKPPTPISLKPA